MRSIPQNTFGQFGLAVNSRNIQIWMKRRYFSIFNENKKNENQLKKSTKKEFIQLIHSPQKPKRKILKIIKMEIG